MEPEETLNSQSNLEKENQSRRHHNPRLQAILQCCNHQDSMVLAQEQTLRSMEQNREPRNRPTNVRPTNLWQSKKEYPMELRQSLQQVVLGKLDSNMQKNEPGLLSYTIHENKLKMDERPRCKTGSHQNPPGESRQKPLWSCLPQFLTNTSLEARETKAKMNYWDLIKIQSFCTAKNSAKLKATDRMGEDICKRHIR